MKRIFSICLMAGIIMLLIPAVALFVKPATKQESQESPESQESRTKQEEQSKTPKAVQIYYSVTDEKNGKLLELTPTEYIKGVVAAEMPMSYEPEALKAQAVAAHSYALVQIDQAFQDGNNGYLSTDPSKCQGYLSKKERAEFWGDSAAEYEEKLTSAVQSVIDEVLTYDKKPILAAFHSMSNGKTETAETVWGRQVPYLLKVDSAYDLLSPDYKSVAVVSKSELASAMLKKYPDIKFSKNIDEWFTEIKKSDSGTVTSLKVGTIETTGLILRELLGLKSPSFDIVVSEDDFIFTVSGYGHGVGMSQFGANYMAQDGKDYKMILSHYYLNTQLEKISV